MLTEAGAEQEHVPALSAQERMVHPPLPRNLEPRWGVGRDVLRNPPTRCLTLGRGGIGGEKRFLLSLDLFIGGVCGGFGKSNFGHLVLGC